MRNRTIALTALTSLALATAGCGSSKANDGTTTLKAISSWDETSFQSRGLVLLKEKVEEMSDGEIAIEFTGGPESIPSNEQTQAVRTGIVDIVLTSPAYYAGEVPAAQVLDYSEKSPTEEIDSGAIEYLSEIHETSMNAVLLGRGVGGSYAIYSAEEVNTVSDLQRRTYRVNATYQPLAEAMGAEHIEISRGELYSAMERGVVNAFFATDHGEADFGLHEVSHCKVEPFFWRNDSAILMNLDSWEDLSDESQEVIAAAAKEVATEMVEEADEYREQDADNFATCELEDGEQLLDLASEAGWDYIHESVPADQAAALEEMLRATE